MQQRETYLLRLITTESSEDKKEELVIRLQTVASGEEHRFSDLKSLLVFLEKTKTAMPGASSSIDDCGD
jgi:hypothetical protein